MTFAQALLCHGALYLRGASIPSKWEKLLATPRAPRGSLWRLWLARRSSRAQARWVGPPLVAQARPAAGSRRLLKERRPDPTSMLATPRLHLRRSRPSLPMPESGWQSLLTPLAWPFSCARRTKRCVLGGSGCRSSVVHARVAHARVAHERLLAGANACALPRTCFVCPAGTRPLARGSLRSGSSPVRAGAPWRSERHLRRAW